MEKWVKRLVAVVFAVAVLGTTVAAYAAQVQSAPVGSGQTSSAPATAPATDQQQAMLDALLVEYQKNPQDIGILIQIGNVYYDTQRFDLAVDYYGKALELDPANTNVLVDRGAAFFYQGLYEEARAEYRKALDIDPNKIEAHFNLALSLAHGEPSDVEGAIAEWEEVIELQPDSEEAASAARLIEAFQGQEQGEPE